MTSSPGTQQTDNSNNRREFSRVKLQLGVTFRQNDGTPWLGHVLDISASGVHAAGSSPPSVESAGEICISLGGDAQPTSIYALGRVGRVADSEVVLQFNELLGLESLEHLRQLIQANADDPAEVESEFAAHIGLKKRSRILPALKGGNT